MKTFRDFFIWYNNIDMVPFLEALPFYFYRNRNIDIRKEGINFPG